MSRESPLILSALGRHKRVRLGVAPFSFRFDSTLFVLYLVSVGTPGFGSQSGDDSSVAPALQAERVQSPSGANLPPGTPNPAAFVRIIQID